LLNRVRDKAEIVKVARKLGIGVPETYEPKSEEEVRSIASRVSYPCVVKYRRGTGSLGIRYARSPEELVAYWGTPAHDSDIVFDDPKPIIQEYFSGVITDVCCLFRDGKPRAAEVHQRIKTYPPSGGWGVSYLTVDMPELKEKGLRLLEEVGWHGPGLVEFKVDPRTGAEKLMEVNTRFWGGLDVSYRAGVDFAWLTCRLAVEGDVDPVWDYRVGMRYRFMFSSELKSTLAGDDRFAGMLDYLTLRRGTHYEVWLSDPLPYLVSAGLTLYRAGRRLVPW
ncbi:MAG: carboxylate--amine ligase, partial [Planctomycetota bacterium]